MKGNIGFDIKIPLFVAVIFIVVGSLVGCNKQEGNGIGDAKAMLGPKTKTAMVKVAAGEFIRGSNKVDKEGIQQRYGFPATLYLDERPKTKINVDTFYIDTYEVTNAQYKEFIVNAQRMIPFTWLENGYVLTENQLKEMSLEQLRKVAVDSVKLDIDTREMKADQLVNAIQAQQKVLDSYPVGNVNWFDAKAYCEWRSARLPTEIEWEKAARGTEGWEYPWGNEWDPKITNTGDDGKWEEGDAPVGKYPKNKSPYGAYDMSGNVWEWVEDWYQAYPGATFQSPFYDKSQRVVRGGGGGVGHYAISYFFRAATRQYSEPEMESPDVGFRCAKNG